MSSIFKTGSQQDAIATAAAAAASSKPESKPGSVEATAAKNAVEAQGKKSTVLKPLKSLLTDPNKAVMENPVLTLVYSVAIKILFYSIAQSFPIFGWAALAFSTALFERAVIFNPKEYYNAVLNTIKDVWQKVKEESKTKSETQVVKAPVADSSSSSSSASSAAKEQKS